MASALSSISCRSSAYSASNGCAKHQKHLAVDRTTEDYILPPMHLRQLLLIAKLCGLFKRLNGGWSIQGKSDAARSLRATRTTPYGSMGAVRGTAPAIAVLSVALLLGGQASAASVRISLSGDSSAPALPRATTSYAGDLSPSVEKSGRLLDNNLGLVAGQALTRVLDQISSTGEVSKTRISFVATVRILEQMKFTASSKSLSKKVGCIYTCYLMPAHATFRILCTVYAP